MSRIGAVLLGVTVAFSLPRAALAQSTVSIIRGSVYDSIGNPMKGVRVIATSPTQIGGPKTAYTDTEGNFRIAGLLPGMFQVTASAPGLRAVTKDGVELSVNAPAELTFILEVETKTEKVTVVQKAPVVSTTAANVKETFSAEFVEAVPLTTPSYQNVADQAVGWNASKKDFRVRGGNTYDNNFMVDGFQISDPVTRQSGQFINFDAISAIEVQSAAYGAENSNAQGGVLNVVTKSGSNDLHGEVSARYTDDNLQFWRDNLDLRQPTRNAYLNLSVGGPIVRDRLWFFIGAEGSQDLVNLGRRPIDLARNLPPDQIPGDDHPSKNQRALRVIGKATYQASTRNKFSLLGLFTPEETKNSSYRFDTAPQAEKYEGYQSFFLGLTYHALVTDNLFYRLQFGHNRITNTVKPMSCVTDPDTCLDTPTRRQRIGNVRLDNWNLYEVSRGINYQINTDIEWFKDNWLGDHRAKLGVRTNINTNPYRSRVPGDKEIIETTSDGTPYGTIIEDRTRYFCNNDPTQVPAGTSEEDRCQEGWFRTTVSGETATLFAQDAWKPTKYLTLTPGAALNYGNHRNPEGDSVIHILAPTPHFSAVWDATRDGKTALRGSFAGYVDTGFLGLARYAARTPFAEERRPAGTTTYTGGLGRNTTGKPCGALPVGVNGEPCEIGKETPRTWEFTAGAEREVAPGVAFGGDFIYRKYINQWHTAEVNRIWNEGGTALNPDGGTRNGRNENILDLSPRPENWRRYTGATFFIRKYDGKFQALIAFTRHAQYGAPLGYTGDFLANPSQTQYWYGYIETDQRNEAKFMGSYRLTNWFTLGFNVVYRNNQPYNHYYYNTVGGDYQDLRAQYGYEPGDINNADDDRPLREDDTFLAFLQARFKLKQFIKQDVEAWADVYNITGIRENQGFVEQDGPIVGVPNKRRELPPYFRFGLKYKY